MKNPSKNVNGKTPRGFIFSMKDASTQKRLRGQEGRGAPLSLLLSRPSVLSLSGGWQIKPQITGMTPGKLHPLVTYLQMASDLTHQPTVGTHAPTNGLSVCTQISGFKLITPGSELVATQISKLPRPLHPHLCPKEGADRLLSTENEQLPPIPKMTTEN